MTALRGGVTGTVTKGQPRLGEETVARLADLVAARGMQVFAVVDHSGEAARVGLELRDTKVILFGSPAAGTPVMAAVPLSALELPSSPGVGRRRPNQGDLHRPEPWPSGSTPARAAGRLAASVR